jgi:plasmid stabilization system protein ParE
VTYWLHPDAEAELGQAAVHYAQHASLAVAEAFLAEFERVRDLLVENQLRGPQIYAIAHQHREPGYWTNRL